MQTTWQDSIYRQREELARMLREPIEQIAQQLTPLWNNQQQIEAMLLQNFSTIPYCTSLYVLDTNGVQICNNIGRTGLVPGHYGRDRSQRPYMNEAVPAWGFLLSDAYISQYGRRPSLTALQITRAENPVLGSGNPQFTVSTNPGGKPHGSQSRSGLCDSGGNVDTTRCVPDADPFLQ